MTSEVVGHVLGAGLIVTLDDPSSTSTGSRYLQIATLDFSGLRSDAWGLETSNFGALASRYCIVKRASPFELRPCQLKTTCQDEEAHISSNAPKDERGVTI